jgi:signal transduction histidine kinase
MTRDPFETRSPYEALESARRVRLLVAICNASVMFTIPVAALYGIVMIGQGSWQGMATFTLSLLLIPLSLVGRHLARQGKANRASYILLPSFMIIVAAITWLGEGLFGAIAPPFILVIMMAGMLLGPRGGYVMAGVASVLWIVTSVVIERGLVPLTPLPEPLEAIVVMAIIVLSFIFVAVMSQFATSDLRRGLDDATYDLVQANRQLEKASRLKSQFTARTSHELRTPLSAIIVFTDLALRKAYGPLTPKQEDSLRRVLQSAKRLQALIEDILDLSKIEAGELEIAEESFVVSDVVEALCTTLETAARQKMLGFSVSVSPNMPQQILGDVKRVTQILLNLTDNAIKFTDEGEVSVLIEPVNGTQWRMAVQDTGRGIREEDAQVIFDEFRQADSAAGDTKAQGAGLGLSITRHLVQMMGGEISLQSEIGKGSTFEVILPLNASKAA